MASIRLVKDHTSHRAGTELLVASAAVVAAGGNAVTAQAAHQLVFAGEAVWVGEAAPLTPDATGRNFAVEPRLTGGAMNELVKDRGFRDENSLGGRASRRG
jgi:hypothetical protein